MNSNSETPATNTLLDALKAAEAALSDIGDAEGPVFEKTATGDFRESPWNLRAAEKRANEALPAVRAALASAAELRRSAAPVIGGFPDPCLSDECDSRRESRGAVFKCKLKAGHAGAHRYETDELLVAWSDSDAISSRSAAVSTPEGEAKEMERFQYKRRPPNDSLLRWTFESGRVRYWNGPYEMPAEMTADQFITHVRSGEFLKDGPRRTERFEIDPPATIPEAAAAAKDPWEPILEKWLDTRGDIVTAEDFAKRCFDAGVAHAAHDRQPPQAVEQLDPDLLAVLNEPWKRSLLHYPMHETFDHKSFRDGYELGLKGRSVAVPAPIPAESAAVPATPERKP